MSKADMIFKDMVEDIIDNGISNEGEFVRTKWEDGTPAYTIKKFGIINRYDLSKEFPIMTYRKTNWENALDEIFWIYQKQSNNIKDLNSKIWDLWADENGTIGKAYGWQLQSEKTNRVVKIKKIIFEKHGELKPIKVNELEKPNENCNHKYCGKIINSKQYGKFIILDVFTGKKSKYNKNGATTNSEALIQFIETGYKCNIHLGNAVRGIARDIYYRNIYGVGYYGDIELLKNIDKEYIKMMDSKWRNIISRCYNKNSHNYKIYGEKGIFVSERWHCFVNFVYDSIRIPQYYLAKRENFRNWEIDKDYFGSNCYSIDSCVWLENKDNAMYAHNKPFILYFPKPSDRSEICLNTIEIKEKYNVSRNIRKVLYGEYKQSNGGYTAKYIEDSENVYRYELAKNQMNDVIYNLKYNKQNRRIMTNFWNFKDSPEKALQECAYSMTYNVVGNKLNAILNQRSSDVFVANNWNVVQYALLVHMLAQVSNLEVGELIHVISDAHIYDKHIPTIKDMIKRETFDAPKLWINPEVKDFYDFKLSDFKLIDYKHNEHIKNIPIAV